MSTIRKMYAVIVALFLVGPLCYGATISGTVKAPDGTPVGAAFVEAQNSKTKMTFMGVSDTQGHYRVEKVPAGEYRLQIRAVGYRIDPQNGVKLSADQNASFNFALQQGTVRWNDLSIYQLSKLAPEGSGKDILFGRCFVCHAFQNFMASVPRDADGWKDRVEFMRTAMHFNFGGGFTDDQAATISAYLTSLWSPNSTLPKSPADMPEYKSTLRNYSNTATNINYVEYDMPGPERMPFSAAPAKDGTVWIPDFGDNNKITRLDPKTGQMQDYPVPNQGTAAIHSAIPGPDGTVWLAEQGSNKVGRWDPTTMKITEYQDAYQPGKEGLAGFGEKHTVVLDLAGNVWSTGSPLAKLDPETGKFTRFDQIPHLYGMVADKEGNMWFTKHDTSQIGKVDTKTMKVTLYDPPSHMTAMSWGIKPDKNGKIRLYPRRISMGPDGMVYVAEFNAGYIVRFDPKAETFKEFPLPGPEPTPYALRVDDNGMAWYASYNQDVVGCLDTKTGNVTEYPFPHSEITSRDYFPDAQGRMWYGSPSNDKVGYFYLTGKTAGSGN